MIQKKRWLQLEEIKGLVKSGENNVETHQEEQNETDTKPI